MASGLHDCRAEFDSPTVWDLINNIRCVILVEAYRPIHSSDQSATPEADGLSDSLRLIADRNQADHGGARVAFPKRPVLKGAAQSDVDELDLR